MTSPWMDSSEACEYLRFVDKATGKPQLPRLYHHLRLYNVTVAKRGAKSLLIDRAELMATVQVQA